MEETDAMMHPPTQALFLGRKPPGPGQKTKLDFPADVHWVPADRIAEAGPDWGGNQRHFESLRQAIEFVMQGLTIADRANVWIATDDGNLMVEQIEQLQ
jgi:hypothetical protein